MSEASARRSTWLVNAYGFAALALCLACPWTCWFLWGPWAGLAGAFGAHVLYMLLLAPRSGICLGPARIFVFLNGVLALAGLAGTLVWRMIR
jgi:hypothetical protein